jgi:acyl-coenzyme A thioesterase PaaI-like protein
MGAARTESQSPSAPADKEDLRAQTHAFQHLDEPAMREPPPEAAAKAQAEGQAAAPQGGVVTPNDPVARGIKSPTQPGWFDKVEAFVSRLSVRDNFWNSVCSLLWLPLAFFSGIRMKELEPGSFAAQAILPFRRFNRNWYRAMAGGALLANSEIAGGSYVFGICGADYTVVCKNLNYTFLRPCFGPAVYRMNARENVKELVTRGGEFNVTIDMEVSQQGFRGERDRRVGKCEATFHVTPKVHHKRKSERKKK